MDENTFIEMSNKIEEVINEYGWHIGTLCHHKPESMIVYFVDGSGLEINGELVFSNRKAKISDLGIQPLDM